MTSFPNDARGGPKRTPAASELTASPDGRSLTATPLKERLSSRRMTSAQGGRQTPLTTVISVAMLCIAFATLVLKIIEVARK